MPKRSIFFILSIDRRESLHVIDRRKDAITTPLFGVDRLIEVGMHDLPTRPKNNITPNPPNIII